MAVATDRYEFAEILMVSSVNSEMEWILDSGCTFHTTPNKAWFENSDKVMEEWFFWEIIDLVRFKALV